MVLQVVWTRKALDDLRAIKDYIARDSTRYAQLQIERIRSAASHIDDRSQRVYVLAVIHGMQLLRASMVELR